MDQHGIRNEIADDIREHGFHIIAVFAPLPDAQAWAYTVGLWEAGHPELLVFGLDPHSAGHVLTDLRERLLRQPDLARPGTIVDVAPDRRIRLDPVAERWMEHYPVWALEYYGPEVQVLQAVLSDAAGRLPDGEDPDHGALRRQPLLRDPQVAWPVPLSATWYHDPPRADVEALVPILRDGEVELREEAVPARLIGPDTARLLRPPLLADWVTAGTEVRLISSGAVGERVPIAEVTRVSPRSHLTYTLHDHDEDHHRSWHAIEAALAGLDAIVSEGRCTVNIAVPAHAAARARSRLRHLERDGLVTAEEPYHRPSITPDPRCACCGRSLRGDG